MTTKEAIAYLSGRVYEAQALNPNDGTAIMVNLRVLETVLRVLRRRKP